MGVVYRAEYLKPGREAALKFLSDEITADRTAVDRFEQEARAAAAITHPNICTVYEVGEHEGSPYLAMELLEGETRKHKIRAKPLPLETLLDWAIQITNAGVFLHAFGLPRRAYDCVRGRAPGQRSGMARRYQRRKAAFATGTNGGPSCSPDGEWVCFNSLDTYYALWRVPLRGGAAEQLSRFPSTLPLASPDGRWIAFTLDDPNRSAFGIIPATGDAPAKTFDFSYVSPTGEAIMRWSPKGDAIDYVDARNGVSRILRQPLEGGPPLRVAGFNSACSSISLGYAVVRIWPSRPAASAAMWCKSVTSKAIKSFAYFDLPLH